MRISDWSSDVCSSDLIVVGVGSDIGRSIAETDDSIDQGLETVGGTGHAVGDLLAVVDIELHLTGVEIPLHRAGGVPVIVRSGGIGRRRNRGGIGSRREGIGRASGRESVCKSVYISVVGGYL